jgi:hypothetical protein
MVTILVIRDKMEVIEAEEFIHYNIIGAKMEGIVPIIIHLDFNLITHSL